MLPLCFKPRSFSTDCCNSLLLVSFPPFSLLKFILNITGLKSKLDHLSLLLKLLQWLPIALRVKSKVPQDLSSSTTNRTSPHLAWLMPPSSSLHQLYCPPFSSKHDPTMCFPTPGFRSCRSLLP